MQRNKADAKRVKELKIKATRRRPHSSKTTVNGTSRKKKSSKKRKSPRSATVPKIFGSFESIECTSKQTECIALERVIHILQLYTKFLTKHNSLYHEGTTLSHSTSQPVTPLQSTLASSPYDDIVTESNLIPSKHSTKKKSSKKYKMNGSKRANTPTTSHLNHSHSDAITGFFSSFANLGGYNNIHLLNDFNHLTEEHDIHALVDHTKHECICNVHHCISLNRMYRNRLKCSKNHLFREAQYLGFNDSNEIITQQIMDRIHIYILHTLDVGMKLNPKDFETKDDKEDDTQDVHYTDVTLCKMNESIASKRMIIEKLTGNKYITKFTSIMEESAFNQRHYSPRFYYWSTYSNWEASDKHNPGYNYQDWFCDAKHLSLKHELLNINNNQYAFLSNAQWNVLIQLCAVYKQCTAIKNIKADFEDLHGYGIKRYAPISAPHLMALLIYCNFEDIRKRFCQTFVRVAAQETDEHLMQRHSQFAHLARLLRESVEVFGQRTLFSKVNRFYHGLDKEFRFKQTYDFNGPTSTSLHYETVLNLNKKYGVILQLADKNDTHINGGLRFFDTSLLSDFVYECDMLFVSSQSTLHIETVIECNLGHNYADYVHCIDVLYQMMKGERYKNVMNDKKDELYKKHAYKLIEHQLSKHEPQLYAEYTDLPKYIDDLLNYFFLSTTQIQMNCEHLSDKRQFELFDNLFINDKCLQLQVFWKLFPNITSIAIHSVKERLVFDEDGFARILKSLSSLNKSHANLQEIIFKEAVPRSVLDLISQYEHMFIESQWFITQQGSTLAFRQSFDMV